MPVSQQACWIARCKEVAPRRKTGSFRQAGPPARASSLDLLGAPLGADRSPTGLARRRMPGGVDDPSIAGPGRLDGLNYRFSYPQHAIVFHHVPCRVRSSTSGGSA